MWVGAETLLLLLTPLPPRSSIAPHSPTLPACVCVCACSLSVGVICEGGRGLACVRVMAVPPPLHFLVSRSGARGWGFGGLLTPHTRVLPCPVSLFPPRLPSHARQCHCTPSHAQSTRTLASMRPPPPPLPDDPYAALGVPRSASTEDIKAAFRRAALAAHPDRCGPGASPGVRATAAARFAAVSAAYEVLGDGAWAAASGGERESSSTAHCVSRPPAPLPPSLLINLSLSLSHHIPLSSQAPPVRPGRRPQQRFRLHPPQLPGPQPLWRRVDAARPPPPAPPPAGVVGSRRADRAGPVHQGGRPGARRHGVPAPVWRDGCVRDGGGGLGRRERGEGVWGRAGRGGAGAGEEERGRGYRGG